MNTHIKLKTCLSCIHCGKEYKNNSSLNKHVLLCELVSRKETSSEQDIPPSNKRLYQMLVELTYRYKQMEERLNFIEVSTRKKKINVIEWLNANNKPETTFSGINIQIQTSDISLLFEANLNAVFSEIFKRLTEKKNIPVFAFSQKKNSFYCYELEEWREMEHNDFIQMFGNIRIKLSKSLLEWKHKHVNELIACEKTAHLYDSTNLKLMKHDFTNQRSCGGLKSMLFNMIKTNIKHIIEYEVDF